MLLRLLNTNLEAITIVDTYKSLIWAERYKEYGDFEIYTPVSSDVLANFKQDYYLDTKDSDCVMIIEKLKIDTDAEEGNNITITGRSLESILERRIIWGTKTISGNLQNGVKTLLDENIISPIDPARKIDNFVFEESIDPLITELTIEAQYTGDNLYDVIVGICDEHDIGFKVTLNNAGQFVFKLYAGVDRSYEQNVNPYVVFSPNFENLLNSKYIESKASLKNVTLVGGEEEDDSYSEVSNNTGGTTVSIGENTARRYATVGDAAGLDRRELFTDARDIQSKPANEPELTDEEYLKKLEQRGQEKLAENKSITSFEGEIESTMMFVYGEDFFNGDIIQIANEYGHEARARILEVVINEDESGTSVRPTFSTITEEGE